MNVLFNDFNSQLQSIHCLHIVSINIQSWFYHSFYTF